MLVTVIIVTYNAGLVVHKSIESVLNQTYSKVECLLIDGKSTDTVTLNTIRSYGEKIRYISESDKGIYDAMNKGWQLAKGEWIIYLGADDELESDAIEHLIASSSDADIVYGDTTFIQESRIKKVKSLPENCIRKGMITSHQSMMMRLSVIEHLGGFDTQYKISADFDLAIKAYLADYRFVYVPYFISRFNCNGVSATSCNNIFESYHILKKYGTMPLMGLYFITVKYLIRKSVKLILRKLHL